METRPGADAWRTALEATRAVRMAFGRTRGWEPTVRAGADATGGTGVASPTRGGAGSVDGSRGSVWVVGPGCASAAGGVEGRLGAGGGGGGGRGPGGGKPAAGRGGGRRRRERGRRRGGPARGGSRPVQLLEAELPGGE